MPTTTADVIVVGLGAHGSSAACHLARRGLKVIAFDTHRPPHTFGSSHGGTRIIRQFYGEGAFYVPLIKRAYELWEDLERRSGEDIMRITGGISIADTRGRTLSAILTNAKPHNIPLELLSPDEIRRRFPVLRPHEHMQGAFDPRAGGLFPEKAVAAHLSEAQKAGADLHFNERITKWRPDRAGHSVQVETASGSYSAAQLVFAAGAWLPELVSKLSLPMRIERQVLYWFAPRANAAAFKPEKMGNHSWEFEPFHYLYAQPDYGEGVKVAIHHDGADANPDTIDRKVKPKEEQAIRAQLERYVPDLNGRLLKSAVCMYTDTPDYHFLIDFHPGHKNILLISPCSGHGFKFSSVTGEIVADMVTKGRSNFDLSNFNVQRLLTPESQAACPPERRPDMVR
jgi:sarcosine oxidase